VTIYGEARSESEKGQVAVAYTVLNRAVNKSLCQVALAPKQYSVFNNNPELRAAATSLHINPKQRNVIDKNSWDQALKVARMVMQKAVKDPTNGATHYIADRVMKAKGYTYPKWSRQYQVVAVIENHKFFKKA
jgi:spore germination cell wall hydrolase CwlJ-like protein